MRYRNKYFDRIGYKKSYTEHCILGMKDDKRQRHWKKQQKECGGYDERCLWDLFLTVTEQIYTYLSMYREIEMGQGIVKDHEIKTNCKILRLSQSIDSVLKDLKFCLTNYGNWDKDREVEDTAQKAYSLLGIILPYLWS